jgi:hypothetical protein
MWTGSQEAISMARASDDDDDAAVDPERPKAPGPERDDRPSIADSEDDEPTDVAGVQHTYTPCLPCGATGWMAVQTEMSAPGKRRCVVCGGTGYRKLLGSEQRRGQPSDGGDER